MDLSTATSPASRSLAPGHVLVVEDNDTTRQRITMVLQAHGYRVAEATDGVDALQKVTANRFQAIVLDLVLPHMDGWQFRATQMAHPELAAIPTVIVTVQSLRPPARYALRSENVVQKPFEDDELIAAVERACGRAQPVPAEHVAETRELVWSRRGEIACMNHAPEATSPRWHDERWRPIPPGAGRGRITYQCQHCTGQGSPIAHGRRGSTGTVKPEN